MTFSGIIVILHYSTEFSSFADKYIKAVKDRPELSETKMQSNESSF